MTRTTTIDRAGSPALMLLLLAALAAPAAAQGGPSIYTLLDPQGRALAAGDEVSGALTEQDYVSGGRHVQAWALEGQAGQAVQIDMTSDELDPYLYLAGPGIGEMSDDDGGDGTNSRLCVQFPESGTYRVVASSFGGDVGPFQLRATDRPDCEAMGIGPAEVTDLATLDTGDRAVPWDGQAEGSLSMGDPQSFGSPVQAWALQGRAGQSLTIDLVSSDFDAYLTVLGPGLDDWISNDDGAGRCDSRVTVTFPDDGMYRAIVSSVSGTGGFTLTSYRNPPPPQTGRCIPPLAEEEGPSSGSIDELPDRGTVEVGSSVTGNLTSDGFYESRPAERWTLEAREGQQLAIQQTSDLIDSYLYLRGPGFEQPQSNDDVDDSLNSRICVTIPETGTYTIVSAGFGSGDTGPYRLSVTADPNNEICDDFTVSLESGFARVPLEGQALEPGVEIQGSLDPNVDARHPTDGSLIDIYGMDAEAGQSLVVDLISDDFDAFMYVTGPGLTTPIIDDDGGGRCNSRIELAAPRSGTYRVIVNSLSDTGSGAYTLRVSNEAGPVAEGDCLAPTTQGTPLSALPEGALDNVQPEPGREFDVGTDVAGSLVEGDPVIEDGKHAQAWTLHAEQGETVVVEVVSDDFDTILHLTGADFPGVLTDDDGGPGTGSRVTFTPREGGTYRVVVTSYGADATGAFRLRAMRVAEPGG